ncbi:MAG: hypothetical protein KTR32_13590 [Granulosicoccus sp.]|nr:hypothetical protein [Granulosicoccus sp.]
MRVLSLITLALVVSLAGCAGHVSSQIKEKDKDLSGTYDGQWKADVLRSPATQYGPDNWRFNCSGKPQQFSFSVNDSQAAVNYKEVSHTTYVDKNGKFRFEIPMDVNMSASGTSDSSIDRGAMTMIIVGTLKSNTGRITYGIEQFANQGCSAKINYSKG